jgi:PAS domain S-box-containing protein
MRSVGADGTAGAVGPLAVARRRARSSRTVVLGGAALLAAGVFALGFAASDPADAVAVLYTLPIALIAIEVGAAGGIAMALVALALLGLWAGIDDVDLGVLAFITRGIGFLLLGGVLGHFSSKLRSAYHTVRQREQQLQAILDNTTNVIALKDKEGRYLLVNRKFEELFRLKQDQVRGKTDHDLFPRYIADAFRANDRRVLKECAPLQFEETAPTDEAGDHTYLSVKFPLLDDHGDPYCVCLIATDITRRKEAEKQLKESKDRFREILDSAQEAFVSMNSEGTVMAWNRAAEQTFGWQSEKAIGRPLADIIVPERYREAHWRGLEKFMKTGKGPIMNKRIELMALHRDGREFPIEMTVTPVRVRGGFTFNAFMHDISERKQVEQEAVKLSAVTGGGNGGPT